MQSCRVYALDVGVTKTAQLSRQGSAMQTQDCAVQIQSTGTLHVDDMSQRWLRGIKCCFVVDMIHGASVTNYTYVLELLQLFLSCALRFHCALRITHYALRIAILRLRGNLRHAAHAPLRRYHAALRPGTRYVSFE